MTEDPLAFARRRLKQGSSDAEVRLELLDQNVEAGRIEEVMRIALPRRSVSWPQMVIGLVIVGIGLAVFVTRSAAMLLSGEAGTGRAGIALCLVGAAVFARGLVPRG